MARVVRADVVLALAMAACGRTEPLDASRTAPADAHPRQAYFSPGSENYAYYEGTSVGNRCSKDQGCSISGCSNSTCAAEVVAIGDPTFCQGRMAAAWPEPQLATCGCLGGACLWYFENDYGRPCAVDADCAGLGPPPGGVQKKSAWACVAGACQF